MDREKAIRILTLFREEWDRHSKTPNAKALDMAIEALDKQIPKKPELEGEYYVCPVCGVYQETSEGNPPYCINCGQAIGWEEEE